MVQVEVSTGTSEGKLFQQVVVALADFYLVLLFCSVLVTAGSIRWYLQPIQVTQVVQLLLHPYVSSQEGMLRLPVQL